MKNTSNEEEKNTENELKENNKQEQQTKPKKKISLLDTFWDILEAIFTGVETGISSAEDTTTEKNDIDYGDTVYVNYSGKIGVVVDKIGDSYTVKLKNEDEQREYCETYTRNEISPY